MLKPKELNKRVKRVFYGWWIVAGGFTIQMLVTSLVLHSFTAYFPLLQAQFGWSRTLLSGAFSLSRAESGLLGPIQGWLIEKLGPRAVTRLGIVMLGVGFILFSQINSILSYYLTFALMAIGASLSTYLTVSSTVVSWFIKRRALAVGLTMSGFGFGGVLVPIVAWALLTFGWRPTSLFSGILVILMGLPIAQIMRRSPEEYGYLPDGETRMSPHQNSSSELTEDDMTTMPSGVETTDFTLRQAMNTRSFWFLSLGHASAVLTVGAVSLHLIPHVIHSAGLSIQTAAGAVAAMTVFNIIGQLGGGLLGDRTSKRAIAAWCMILHSAAMIILAYATSITPVFIFAVMHGLAWGIRGPLMTTIRADHFGRRHFASIMGFSSLIIMIGMISGPLFAGFMADVTGSYTSGFIIIAVLTAIGSVFFVLSSKPQLPEPRLRN